MQTTYEPARIAAVQPPVRPTAAPMTGGAVAGARVLIVDDHELLRVGIKFILGTVDHVHFELLEASTLSDAMALYGSEPDIALVLLDLNMPDCRGLQGLTQFMQAFPGAQVAVMSGTQDEFVIGQVRALGAIGYIMKGQSPQALSEIVLSLLGLPLAGDAAAGNGSWQSRFPRFPKSASYDRVAELGPRHLEILDLVLFGCSNQEISSATRLSLGTIKNYVSTILLALDVKSRSHLISLFR
jgi:DNA-binding NarL/FixJ family response regulator